MVVDDSLLPLAWQDGIVKSGSLYAMILSFFLGALAVVGLVVHPDWSWVAPITCTVAALAANYRLRHAIRYRQVAVFGVITLVLLVGAGALLVILAKTLSANMRTILA
ncbi:hypothetical protein [Actinokineospora xionganensis]|uniref:Uncharacterized protein n=1 Tax=Actinokineospora xionganensis TaxID=2684470 RepID=A0ABR7L8R6_9PSEU|nr:hypothetical protein [Actinokineospora xionganensis]MBC6448776.1 hypothetical protein [Actinokineospora xionganensis]